jgi:hypothetical protein
VSNKRSLYIDRVAVGSDIRRVYPNAPFVVYAAGTTTPIVRSGTANEFGVIELVDLAVGSYDLWIDGALREQFELITAAYIVKRPQTWVCCIRGTISADVNETENTEVFYTAEAGKIERIVVLVEYADATADATIHIVKGVAQGATALTTAASIWSVQCKPLAEKFRWAHVDTATIPAIEAQRCLTLAVDWVAGTIKGVTVMMIFKAD